MISQPAKEPKTQGPWLLYPSASSEVFFRPAPYISGWLRPTAFDKSSLSYAAQAFDHTSNPKIMDTTVAQLGYDFNHNGWEYLKALKRHYSHLPLSTFEAWKSVARNSKVLATLLLCMGDDLDFYTQVNSRCWF